MLRLCGTLTDFCFVTTNVPTKVEANMTKCVTQRLVKHLENKILYIVYINNTFVQIQIEQQVKII